MNKLIVAAALLASTSLSAAAGDVCATIRYDFNDDLNVRSGPGIAYPVVRALHPGDTVPILKGDARVPRTDGTFATWQRVMYEGNGIGWVNASYIQPTHCPVAQPPVIQPPSQPVVVTVAPRRVTPVEVGLAAAMPVESVKQVEPVAVTAPLGSKEAEEQLKVYMQRQIMEYRNYVNNHKELWSNQHFTCRYDDNSKRNGRGAPTVTWDMNLKTEAASRTAVETGPEGKEQLATKNMRITGGMVRNGQIDYLQLGGNEDHLFVDDEDTTYRSTMNGESVFYLCSGNDFGQAHRTVSTPPPSRPHSAEYKDCVVQVTPTVTATYNAMYYKVDKGKVDQGANKFCSALKGW